MTTLLAPAETAIDLHRRADALAAAIFRQLSGLPLGDQRHVLAALNERYPFEPTSVSQERALEATRAFCAAQLAVGEGTRLGKKRYSQWRREQPVCHEYPEVKTIVRAFGSWDQAILAAGAGMDLDLRAARMLSAPAFSEERIVETIRLFAAETDGPLTLDGYLAWCRRVTDSPSATIGRVPLVGGPIQRLGGWRALLERAGLGHRAACLRRSRAAIETRQYTDETLLATLREAQEAHGERYLTGGLFRLWREQQVRAGRAEIPSAELYCTRFGSWNMAKRAAGLPCSSSHSGFSTLPYSKSEMTEALLMASRQVGEQGLSAAHYDRWRSERYEPGGAARIPSAITIRLQLGRGSWRQALEAVGVTPAIGTRPSISRDEQIRAVLTAIEATGVRHLSAAGYSKYRSSLEANGGLPHAKTIKNGLGGGRWRIARALALGEAPDG
ncbi:MAG: hypothetical protein V9E83_09315 [Baekduia sp.]